MKECDFIRLRLIKTLDEAKQVSKEEGIVRGDEIPSLVGTWIATSAKGDFNVCKPENFNEKIDIPFDRRTIVEGTRLKARTKSPAKVFVCPQEAYLPKTEYTRLQALSKYHREIL